MLTMLLEHTMEFELYNVFLLLLSLLFHMYMQIIGSFRVQFIATLTKYYVAPYGKTNYTIESSLHGERFPKLLFEGLL